MMDGQYKYSKQDCTSEIKILNNITGKYRKIILRK